MNRLLAGRLSTHWVHGWVWDAVSAFANTGYAPVAYVRGSYCYVPGGDIRSHAKCEFLHTRPGTGGATISKAKSNFMR